MILTISRDGTKLRWCLTRGDAILYMPGAWVLATPDELNLLPGWLLTDLFKGFCDDNHTNPALWSACERNVTIYAPGELVHELLPIQQVVRPARLTKFGIYQCTTLAKTFAGPRQARVLMTALSDAFGLEEFSTAEARTVFEKPDFMRQWTWQLTPIVAFRWYRSTFIKAGVLRMIKTKETELVKLNEVSVAEIRAARYDQLKRAGRLPSATRKKS